MFRKASIALALAMVVCVAAHAVEYSTEIGITYCTVNGKELKLNAFLPKGAKAPSPVMVDIHGGWWEGGAASDRLEGIWGNQALTGRDIAIFSITYRLAKEGGFPEAIRDCRNAIRFIRKNAQRFNIDPERIGCMGGSAGSHLSMMCAMVPEDFDDGGPTDELKGVSAKVCNAFSFVGPTDFVRQWDEAPSDVLGDGSFRPANGKIPHDARPRHRRNFKGITPDTEANRALYHKMSPIGHLRKDIAPLLIVDGERDPIVPYHHGKYLHEKLQQIGADSVYYMIPAGGHQYPSQPQFQPILNAFLTRTLKLDGAK